MYKFPTFLFLSSLSLEAFMAILIFHKVKKSPRDLISLTEISNDPHHFIFQISHPLPFSEASGALGPWDIYRSAKWLGWLLLTSIPQVLRLQLSFLYEVSELSHTCFTFFRKKIADISWPNRQLIDIILFLPLKTYVLGEETDRYKNEICLMVISAQKENMFGGERYEWQACYFTGHIQRRSLE